MHLIRCWLRGFQPDLGGRQSFEFSIPSSSCSAPSAAILGAVRAGALACSLLPTTALAQPEPSAATVALPEGEGPAGEARDRRGPPVEDAAHEGKPAGGMTGGDLLADAVMGFVRAIAQMHFYGQAHAAVVTTLVDGQHPGGVGVEASESLMGIGVSVALRYERDPLGPTEPVREGVLGSAAFELRPVALAQSDLHRLLDPHLAVGFAVGGAHEQLRAAVELGVGLDVGLMPWLEQHPALTLQYRLRPLQHPSDYALHHLQIGTAWRATF